MSKESDRAVDEMFAKNDPDLNGTPFLECDSCKQKDKQIEALLGFYGTGRDGRALAGTTQLYMAAREGHTDIAKLLLEHHAEVNAQANDGGTPLDAAQAEGHQEVVDLLLEWGTDE